MVAVVFAVIVAVTIPIAAIIAAIVIIAMFECLATIAAQIIGLPIVITTVAVVGLVLAFGYRGAPVIVIAARGLRAGSAREEKKPAQRRRSERCLAKQRLPETMQFHTSSMGAFLVLVGVVCVLYMKHESGINVAVASRAQECVEKHAGKQRDQAYKKERAERGAKRKEAQCCALRP